MKKTFSSSGCLPCTVQRAVWWYIWKYIYGDMLEWFLSDYWSGISTRGKLEQQSNTNFQCGNAWRDGEYAQILAMAMSDAVTLV